LEASRAKARAAAAKQRQRPETKARERDYRIKSAALYAAREAARKAQKIRATPPWADMDAIRAIYEECSRITAETGVEHHVDHIVPLRHPKVCGLHVHWNLQIITAEENVRKSNRFVVS
jgi:5-methylcytosine-specific restriction endonuclease McrA